MGNLVLIIVGFFHSSYLFRMGKKKDKKQKGKGAEKTAMKTERKADKKTKKMLKEKGEVRTSEVFF